MVTLTKKQFIAPNPATNRGESIKLTCDPSGKQIVYANGRIIIIRSISNPNESSEYREHSSPVTVAKYSPSGFYIASGDIQGNLRVWDAIQTTHILKYSGKVLNGKVCDLSWDSESKRLVVVGEGKEKFGVAIMFDSGSSVGEVSGHSKTVQACSIRPCRPVRAVTCSDDHSVNFFTGVPFKFSHSINQHSKFVLDVKYSPSGDFFASAGADGKVLLYLGENGQFVRQIGQHAGSVFALSWSPSSKSVASASADGTVRVWSTESGKEETCVTFGNGIEDQQVGLVWMDEVLVSCSLSGTLNVINTGNWTFRSIHGHVKGITALCTDEKRIYTGSWDGQTYEYSDCTQKIVPSGMKTPVIALDFSKKGLTRVTEDTLAFLENGKSSTLPLKGAKYAKEGTYLSNNLLIIDEKPISLDFSATVFDSTQDLIAVGGQDSVVRVYGRSGSIIRKLTANRGPITCLQFSPDSKYLAVGDEQRSIQIFNVLDDFSCNSKQAGYHSARVTAIEWAPDSSFYVSGSLDTNICLWTLDTPPKCEIVKNAHLESVTGVKFIDSNTVATVGLDGFLRIWNIE